MATNSIHQISTLFPAAKRSDHSPQSKFPASSAAAILKSRFPNRETEIAIAPSQSDRFRRSGTAATKRSDHSLQSKAPTISAAAATVPTAAILQSRFPNRETEIAIASSPSERFRRSSRTAAAKRSDHSLQSKAPTISAVVTTVPRAAILRSSVPNREGQNRVDRSSRCRAAAAAAEGVERRSGVPVYVMMPLESATVNRRKATEASFQAMRAAGVEGVMVDVWWGVVEKERSGEYDFGGYVELLAMAAKYGLKVQAVMSFHQCGGNVGDSCTIPLPRWVVKEIQKNPDLAYTDQWGRRNFEYVSLGCDNVPCLDGRTPVQCYADFMHAFKQAFNHLLGNTIVEIQVGMGPAGELRYPSYPEQNGTWKFPGIGAFQCFDKYMLGSLKAAADVAGKPEWGSTGPTDAGSYNNWPEDTLFFKKEGGGWNSSYGEFFLSWYSQILLDHGDRILSHACSIFESSNVKISVKISGIHWHYGTRSHAAELTAGYYNTRYRDGYFPIAQMLALHGAIFNFTCIEMRDHEQPQDAQCAPEKLVRQVSLATQKAQVPLAGENALPRYDEYAHEQIVRTSLLEGNREMCAFTYLRMSPQLFEQNNWGRFVRFVHKMKEGKTGHRGLDEENQQVVPNVQANFVQIV